jgi:hypothetical protein
VARLSKCPRWAVRSSGRLSNSLSPVIVPRTRSLNVRVRRSLSGFAAQQVATTRRVWTRKFLSLGPARSASHFRTRAAMTCASDATVAHNEAHKRATLFLPLFISFVAISDLIQPPCRTHRWRRTVNGHPRRLGLMRLLESNGPTAENESEFGRHPTDAALAHRRDNDAEQADDVRQTADQIGR